jgi:hypothetical protein
MVMATAYMLIEAMASTNVKLLIIRAALIVLGGIVRDTPGC